MIRNLVGAALASAAIVLAGPALGHPGGGGGGGPGAGAAGNVNVNVPMGGPSQMGIDARVNSQGPANASPTGIGHASPNSVLSTNPVTTTTVKGQGTIHANPNAVGRANSNSSLARGSVQASALTGLATNMQVQNTNGTNIGTVSRIVTDSSGNIRLVLVTNATTHQTFQLAPSTLSINGSTLVTTSTVGG